MVTISNQQKTKDSHVLNVIITNINLRIPRGGRMSYKFAVVRDRTTQNLISVNERDHKGCYDWIITSTWYDIVRTGDL